MKRTKVLVVDDHPHIFSIIEMAMDKTRYMVYYAKNGLEGISKSKELHPDIILMDVMMPEMDGYTASLKLKEDPETAEIPIIILTVRGEKIYKMVSQTMGAMFHMTKPFDPEELESKIKSILNLN